MANDCWCPHLDKSQVGKTYRARSILPRRLNGKWQRVVLVKKWVLIHEHGGGGGQTGDPTCRVVPITIAKEELG